MDSDLLVGWSSTVAGSQAESGIAISIGATVLMPPTVTFRRGLDGTIVP